MTTLRQLRTTVWLTLRRARATAALTIAVILAMSSLISVWVGIPLYAESASARLLGVEVDDAASDGVPFGYLVSYNRLSGGNKAWADFAPLNELLAGESTPFGSSVKAQRRVVSSLSFDLITDAGQSDNPATIDTTSFVAMTSFNESANLVEGRFAQPPASNPNGASDENTAIEVMIDREFAEDLGVSVGQEVTMVNRRAPLDAATRSFTILVAGIWEPPTDEVSDAVGRPEDRFLRSGVLNRNLVVPERTMAENIDAFGPTELSNAQWLVLLDAATVTTDSVDALLTNTEQINRQVDGRLRGARVLVTPETSLEGFQDQVADLNRGLALFSLPTLALMLASVALLISMRWSRQQSEIALMRRRGVSSAQIIAGAGVDAILLAIPAAVVGFFGARLVATFMGRTETFLRLGDGVELGLVMNTRSWQALVVAVGVTLMLIVLPSLTSVRNQLLTPRRTNDGTVRLPWWQRSHLDLAAIAFLGFFTWFLLRRDALQGDLLDDPFVILIPAATALAAGLIVLRIFPWMMRQLSRLLARTDSTAALLVTRRNARVPAAVTAPLLLLVITGALAIYTGSLARTLDFQLLDAAHHRIGAQNSAVSDGKDLLGQQFEFVDDGPVLVEGRGAIVDPRTIESIWGVSAASRVTTLPARLETTDRSRESVTFTGIDPRSFARVAFWRDDYAARSLSELMARLQATPDSVLISESVRRSNGLMLGDIVTMSVRDGDRNVAVDMVIVGTFAQFPMWVPGEGAAPVVASLTDFEARAGRNVTNQLLFERDDRFADRAQTNADLARLGIRTSGPRSPDELIERAQIRPERQGIFGLLTVSFAVSMALTTLGFLFYAIFGFTRQLTELGVLRALGLPIRSLMVLVGLDLFFVAAIGTGAAAAVGLGMSRWYLPRLVDNPAGTAPRLLQEIDWAAAVGISLLLACVLAVVTAGLLVTLRHVKLFEAIKIGEPT